MLISVLGPLLPYSFIFSFSYQAKEFVNDGFIDAIKHYGQDSSLDKAVDDLQSKVSIKPNTLR